MILATLTNYQSYKLKAYAVITPEGQSPTVVDIQSLHVSFAINSIPSGVINIALGRSIPSGDAAAIHNYVDLLSVRVPVAIYLQVVPGANSFGYLFERWPSGYFRIFQGLATRTSYRRTRGNVSFQISIAHWLVDLNSSSSITRSSHTLTPQQLATAALFHGGAGVLPAFFAGAAGEDFFNPDSIQTDFWGASLGKWLQSICAQPVLDDGDQPLEANDEGLAALNRFEPFAYTPTGYVNGVAMGLTAATAPGAEFLAVAISEAIASETFESMASSTLWDKLIRVYTADFRFTVVPLENTALVVPAMSGMRRPWQIIYGEEYGTIDNTGDLNRPIKGLHVFSGVGSVTGAMGVHRGEADDVQILAGRYEANNRGMVIHYNAPRWAANYIAPAGFGVAAAAPFGIRGGAIFPGVGAAPAMRPPELRAEATPLWDAYAQAQYATEVLRGRSASIQGKLRFDIAPGSTVELRGVEDKFVQQQVGISASSVMYAEVRGVIINIDAEGLSASTTFSLANIRNYLENLSPDYSVDRHPLYDGFWNGCSLVEQPEFIPNPVTPFGT